MLCNLIKLSKYLFYLNLEGNRISEKGCEVLLNNICCKCSLETINLKSIKNIIYYCY